MIEVHFCTHNLSSKNVFECNWYCFTLKDDLLDLLQRFGCLPFETIEDSLAVLQTTEKLQEENRKSREAEQEENKKQLDAE